MERLTTKWKDNLYDTFDPIDIVDNEYSKINYEKLLTKLGQYEDAEKQGLLLKLPCKAGDTVWYIDDDNDDYPLEFIITKIDVEENCYLRYHAREKDNCGKIGFIKDDIGKTVLLTKDAAEQALKQMGE